MESIFATLQTEPWDTEDWRIRDALANAIFSFIETRYNRQRRHSTPDGITRTMHGLAVGDAPTAAEGAPLPLVIVSHGYPGNRFLVSQPGENLASKGFVGDSINQAERTYADRGQFPATPDHDLLDQRFVPDAVQHLAADEGSFLCRFDDATRTAIVGDSMADYGALVPVGAALAGSAIDLPFAPPERLLAENLAGGEVFGAHRDPRTAALIAIALRRMNAGLWHASGLSAIRTRLSFVTGEEHGVCAIFEGATNAEYAWLTFVHVGHGVAA